MKKFVLINGVRTDFEEFKKSLSEKMEKTTPSVEQALALKEKKEDSPISQPAPKKKASKRKAKKKVVKNA